MTLLMWGGVMCQCYYGFNILSHPVYSQLTAIHFPGFTGRMNMLLSEEEINSGLVYFCLGNNRLVRLVKDGAEEA